MVDFDYVVILQNDGESAQRYVALIRNDDEFVRVIGNNATVVYATREEIPEPRHHLTIIGVVRGDRVEPLIIVEVVSSGVLAPPLVRPRLRAERRGDVIIVSGEAACCGLILREYGMLRVTPAIPVLIANAPWRNLPPADYPSPAYVLQKLLTAYVEEVLLRGSGDEGWLAKDSHAVNISRTVASQRRLLWESRYAEVENPLYYAARALTLAAELLYNNT